MRFDDEKRGGFLFLMRPEYKHDLLVVVSYPSLLKAALSFGIWGWFPWQPSKTMSANGSCIQSPATGPASCDTMFYFPYSTGCLIHAFLKLNFISNYIWEKETANLKIILPLFKEILLNMHLLSWDSWGAWWTYMLSPNCVNLFLGSYFSPLAMLRIHSSRLTLVSQWACSKVRLF